MDKLLHLVEIRRVVQVDDSKLTTSRRISEDTSADTYGRSSLNVPGNSSKLFITDHIGGLAEPVSV